MLFFNKNTALPWAPLSLNIGLYQMACDWWREREHITLNGESLESLFKKINLKENTKDFAIKFATEILYPYILAKMPKEICHKEKIDNLISDIKEQKLLAIYKKPFSEFAHELYLKPISPLKKREILDSEKIRQIAILKKLFSEVNPHHPINTHLHGLTELIRLYFQGAIFDLDGAALSLRATENNKQLSFNPKYDLTISPGQILFQTHLRVVNMKCMDFPKEIEGASNPEVLAEAQSQFTTFFDTESIKTRMSAYKLNIYAPTLNFLHYPSETEILNQKCHELIESLTNEIKQATTYTSLFKDPLGPIFSYQISKNEISLKKEKLCVIKAASLLLAGDITLEAFGITLKDNPRYAQGFTSRTRPLIDAILKTKTSHEISRIQNARHY